MSERTERQALKDALPAIEAVIKGKRVRPVNSTFAFSGEGAWSSVVDRQWCNTHLRWEIEPDPQTRPLTAEEALMELWGKVIVRKFDGRKFGVTATWQNTIDLCGHNDGFINPTFEKLHTDYTHLDGSVIGKVVEPGPA